MESQHHKNTRPLRKLGIKRSRINQSDQPRIKPSHHEDLPTEKSDEGSESSFREMREMDQFLEELWQGR